MPELPEVEVTRLSFGERIAGGRIGAVRLGAALRWPLGCAPEALVGRQVRGVRRRGKYLLLDLDAGLLLVHLGMSGSLSFGSPLPPPGKHDHFELVTDCGTLRLHDPRRFGAVVFAASETDPVATKLLGKLGVEPLTEAFNATEFHRALQSRRGPIKQVLLAGDVVVGVGNIYASEALFLAGIRPTVKALRLTLPRVVRLHAAVQQVLAQAVAQGGSTLRDFKNAEGKNGYFQLTAMVYDREGEPCRHCGQPIQRLVQGQRASYFCRHCQH